MGRKVTLFLADGSTVEKEEFDTVPPPVSPPPGRGVPAHGLPPTRFHAAGARAATSPRKDPRECGHDRFLDKRFPYTGTCLECGAEIVLGQWRLTVAGEQLDRFGEVMAEGNVLGDDDLHAERERYHGVWDL